MKKNFQSFLLTIFTIFIFLPLGLSAEEAATSSTSSVSSIESIEVTINVRHKDLLVYSDKVSIFKNSTTTVTDNSGTSHSIPLDSALAALKTADDLSSDFALSDLVYYSSFDSLYINCINIIAKSENACGNWQYVVNSTYPAVGADKYTLSGDDTVYFYFGNPRRVTLSNASAEASTTITAKAENYDYVNNAWTALSGAAIGVTKPNPDDPYSPLVIFSATSGSDGIASLILDAPGSYNIGLAMDYYFPSEPLSILPPAEVSKSSTGGSAATTDTENQVVPATPSSHRRETSNASETTDTPDIKKITEKKNDQPSEAEKMVVKMDIDIDKFLENYKIALENQKKEKEAPVFRFSLPQKQLASVIVAVESEKNWLERLFTKFFNFFGSKK